VNNSELHERTVNVLVKLVDVLDADDLALICWHAGVKPVELMPYSPPRIQVLIKEIRNECTRQAA